MCARAFVYALLAFFSFIVPTLFISVTLKCDDFFWPFVIRIHTIEYQNMKYNAMASLYISIHIVYIFLCLLKYFGTFYCLNSILFIVDVV